MASMNDEFEFSDSPTAEELFSKMNMNTDIVSKQMEFAKDKIGDARIIEVVEGRVYQAIGYTIGYPTVVVTDEDDLLLIDSPESYTEAKRIIKDLRKLPAIGQKPFKHAIVTLFHGDHVWGLRAFTEDAENSGEQLKVIMHEKCPEELKLFDTFKAFKMPRLLRMYGVSVPKPWHLHDGGAHRILIDPKAPGSIVMDHLSFNNGDEVLSRTIGGTVVQFGSVAGYTKDQILTYFPCFKLLHIADVHFFSFPNIYTLRGEPARDTEKWLGDYRKILNWPNVDIMCATHAFPVYGRVAHQERIRNSMDAVKFIHDQTLRQLMKGKTADVISTNLSLPPEQRDRPYNWEIYGCYETAIKAISDFYIGWYSGLAEDLFPLNHEQRADRMLKMVGESKLFEEASKAYSEKDYRWAMEIVSIICLKNSNNRQAKELRTLCMLRLAELTFSVNTRHYLLSMVMEEWGLMPNTISTISSLTTLHIDGVFKNMRAHVDAEKIERENPGSLLLYLKLECVVWKLELRNSVLDTEVMTEVPDAALCLEVSETDFRKYLTEKADTGVISGGTKDDVNRFFSFFDFVDQEKKN